MTEVEQAVVRTLQTNRETFQRYGDHHLAKDPPQTEKAQVNYEQVNLINHTLLLIGQEVVRSPDTLELTPELEERT